MSHVVRSLLGIILCLIGSAAQALVPPEIDVAAIGPGAVQPLNGKWQFIPWELAEPSGAVGERLEVDVPGVWNDSLNTPSGKGYGTYQVDIKLPPVSDYSEYGIYLKRIKTSYRLYVNETLIGRNGEPGITPESTRHVYEPRIWRFPASLNEEVSASGLTVRVTLQVANWIYYKGGIDDQVLFGRYDDLVQDRSIRMMVSNWLMGAFAIMAAYHFVLWLLRRKYLPLFWFSIFCAVMAVRMFVTGEKEFSLFWPGSDPVFPLRVEIWTAFSAVPLTHLFVTGLFRQVWLTPFASVRIYHKIMAAVTWLVFAYLMAISVFSTVSWMGSTLTLFYIYILIVLVHLLVVLAQALVNRLSGAYFFLAGCSVFFGTAVNDALYEAGIINSQFLLHWGVAVFIMAFAFLMAKEFSGAFSDLERANSKLASTNQELEMLNSGLEEEVSKRTEAYRRLAEDLQRLSNSVQNLLDRERKQIAQELHDEMNSDLIAVKMQLNSLSEKVSGQIKQSMESLASQIGEIYVSARRLIHRLRPEVIDTLGLRGAIDELVSSFSSNKLTIQVRHDNLRINPREDQAMVLYSIAKECMVNTSKHAGATTIWLSLRSDEASTFMTYKDDGIGFDMEKVTKKGIGILSMKNRVQAHGGQACFETEPGAGFKLTVQLPC